MKEIHILSLKINRRRKKIKNDDLQLSSSISINYEKNKERKVNFSNENTFYSYDDFGRLKKKYSTEENVNYLFIQKLQAGTHF